MKRAAYCFERATVLFQFSKLPCESVSIKPQFPGSGQSERPLNSAIWLLSSQILMPAPSMKDASPHERQ